MSLSVVLAEACDFATQALMYARSLWLWSHASASASSASTRACSAGLQMTLMHFEGEAAISAILLAFSLGFKAFSSGGGYRGRTDDLLNAIQALYQTELIPHDRAPIETVANTADLWFNCQPYP